MRRVWYRSDPVLWLGGVVLLGILSVYLLPILSSEQRRIVADYFLQIPLQAMVILAILHGLRRIEHHEERSFWRLTAVGMACLMAADILYVPALWIERSRGFDLSVDALYVAFFLMFILAAELRPHRTSGWTRENAAWKLSAVGMTVFVFGCYLYFTVIPSSTSWELFETNIPSFLLFLALNLTLLVRFFYLRGVTESWRGKRLYSILGASFFVWFFADLENLLEVAGVVGHLGGTVKDLIDYSPYLLLIAATRVRNAHDRGPGPAEADPTVQPTRAWLLVVYAFLLPVLHFVLHEAGLLDASARVPQERFIIAWLIVWPVLIFSYQRLLERQARRLDAEVTVLTDEVQVRQQQKMESLGRMAGGIAHDFNNALLVVRGYSELMKRSLESSSPLHENVDQIVKAADRAAELTAQLLAFSHSQPLNITNVDLSAVVTDGEKLLRRLIGEDIELITRLCDEDCTVRGDSAQLLQVMVNLALNSREAMPQGGRLVVETAVTQCGGDEPSCPPGVPPGSYVVFLMSDSGSGMDEELKRRMFEPFQSTKSSSGATGLGLSTVFGIVKQFNGYVLADSSPGEGTAFRVYLPRVEAALAGDALIRPESVVELQGSETILLVEDEDPTRNVIVEFLTGLGYQVLEGCDGQDGLEKAESHPDPIDILVTDIIMPKMGGPEMARHLIERFPDLGIVYVSGYAPDELVRECDERPNQIYLAKPFHLEDLARAVRSVLDFASV